jgi:hypothetical protein
MFAEGFICKPFQSRWLARKGGIPQAINRDLG